MTRFNPRAQRALLTARLVGGLQVALVVAGCGSTMTVNTDYDRAANFTTLKTYTWREGTKLPNPLMEQRVIDAVDAQMKAKGLTRVDSGGDISITYHAAATESMDVQTFSTGSYYGCWGGCMSTASTTVRPVTTGTLIVDMVDARTNKMLWRGSGTDTVTGEPADSERKINEAVVRMFQAFPPKAS